MSPKEIESENKIQKSLFFSFSRFWVSQPPGLDAFRWGLGGSAPLGNSMERMSAANGASAPKARAAAPFPIGKYETFFREACLDRHSGVASFSARLLTHVVAHEFFKETRGRIGLVSAGGLIFVKKALVNVDSNATAPRWFLFRLFDQIALQFVNGFSHIRILPVIDVEI